VSSWSLLWFLRLTRGARRTGGRVAVALGGPAWSGDVGRSRAIAHQHAEDHPLAKVTYFWVIFANHVPCAIVHRGATGTHDRIGVFLQKHGRGRGLSFSGCLRTGLARVGCSSRARVEAAPVLGRVGRTVLFFFQ
jgi:hypothetical protein